MRKRQTARTALALAIAALGLLAFAGVASAATFLNGSGKLAVAPKGKGVKVTTKSVSLAFGQFGADMTNGDLNVSTGGKIVLKGKKKVTLTVVSISGRKLVVKLGKKTLKLSLTAATHVNNHAPAYTTIDVSGININLSGHDAKTLTKALFGKKAHKKGLKAGRFATFSYSGLDRQLIVVGGSSVLCNNPSYAQKQQADGITVGLIAPATLQGAPDCPSPAAGGRFPVANGQLDSATGGGTIGVLGGLSNTQGGRQATFVNSVFHITATPFLTATTPLGVATVATVDLSHATRSVTLTPTGGTVAVNGGTLAINASTAAQLNTLFCSSGQCDPPPSDGRGRFNAGDVIGTANTTANVQ